MVIHCEIQKEQKLVEENVLMVNYWLSELLAEANLGGSSLGKPLGEALGAEVGTERGSTYGLSGGNVDGKLYSS